MKKITQWQSFKKNYMAASVFLLVYASIIVKYSNVPLIAAVPFGLIGVLIFANHLLWKSNFKEKNNEQSK